MLKQKQIGVSLVEILIGLSVGIILTFGVIVFYSNTSKVSNDTLRIVRLEHELQTAMALMKNDIRRAGYTANAAALVGTGTVNPFMVSGSTDIQVPSSSCILLTYDLNMDGTLPALNTASSDDRFGYRLSGGAIQSRAATDATFDCAAGTWENLTNTNLISITNLTFTLTESVEALDSSNPPPGGASITVRQVTITITGQLVSDAAVQRTITSQVRVRNDKYTP